MSVLTQNGKDVKIVATATEKGNISKNEKEATNKKSELQEKKNELSKILTPINAEQRIKNLETLQKMADKHKFLVEKRDSLNAFMVSRDGFKERLIIMNDNSETFEITNSIIIGELINIYSVKLDEMIAESETKITTFQI